MDFFRSHVLVCGGTGCTSSGSLDIEAKFAEELGKHNLENEVKVVRTGCFGLCEAGPIVIVYPEGSFYSRVSADDIAKITEEHLLKGRIVTDLLYGESVQEDEIKSIDEVGFYKKQQRMAETHPPGAMGRKYVIMTRIQKLSSSCRRYNKR